MKLRKANAGAGASPAFRDYMAGKIKSDEYFRRVRKETEKTVRRELDHPSPTEPKPA